MRIEWKALATALVLGAALSTPMPASAQEANDLAAAITQGKPILEFRPRHEDVSQDGVADGEALTVRSRLGWETAQYQGFKALIEIEDVHHLGSRHFNDGVPPAEPYATISDPDVTEINRAQLSWAANQHLNFTFGRQRILFDDQRFVGPSPWRQDEQTFDGARADASFGAFKATYVYVDRVNRVLGDKLDWHGDLHLFNASYTVAPTVKLTGFAYLLDFDRPTPAVEQSSETLGVRVTGAFALAPVRFEYAASYARQQDYGDNPASFDLGYTEVELTANYGQFGARLMYEKLEGNGVRGFSTPLASLHPFNGWAGVFGTTPANGLRDVNVMGVWRAPFHAEHLSNIVFTVREHDFEAERTGVDLGHETDAQATASITPRLTALAKVADYDGTGAPPDTTRVWVGFEWKL